MSRDFSEPTEPKQPPPDVLIVDRERLDRIDAVLADAERIRPASARWAQSDVNALMHRVRAARCELRRMRRGGR